MQNLDQNKIKEKKGFWFKAKITPHTTKTLKNGTKKTYYVVSIPTWAIERGEIEPNKEYIFEIYPVKKENL